MGHKNIYRNSSMETPVFGLGDKWMDKEERPSQFNGATVRNGNNRNNSKMGEAFKTFLNAIGFTTYIMGIVVNLNNWISIALGAVGVGFAVVKLLHAVEVLRIKKIDRLERERAYRYSRNIEDEEQDELEN